MKAMANALVYAVTYISLRESDDLDSDVGALESIAADLQVGDRTRVGRSGNRGPTSVGG